LTNLSIQHFQHFLALGQLPDVLQIPAASVLDHMLLRLFLLFLQQVLVQLQVPDSADASLWVEHWHAQLL